MDAYLADRGLLSDEDWEDVRRQHAAAHTLSSVLIVTGSGEDAEGHLLIEAGGEPDARV
jgi:hypothetical protein